MSSSQTGGSLMLHRHWLTTLYTTCNGLVRVDRKMTCRVLMI
jgi:hypothetical protein